MPGPNLTFDEQLAGALVSEGICGLLRRVEDAVFIQAARLDYKGDSIGYRALMREREEIAKTRAAIVALRQGRKPRGSV